jgi:4-hydroxybenzoate polyprenyltransferase
MSKGRAILGTLRPKQWVKNFFVLAALVFSKHLLDPAYAWRAGVAFLVFCALSGAVYAFNDLRDVTSDRKHPLKRFRPIASGALSEKSAFRLSVLLGSAALAGAALLSPMLALAAGAYLVNNLAYTLYLKRIAYLDVLMIAVGFLMRVLAGGYAIDVPVSSWLLACTALLACFLGFGKRAHELSQAEKQDRHAEDTRAALAGYQLGALRFTLVFLAIGTCAAYALYTRDATTIDFFKTDQLLWTLPFCIFGIARFLYITLWTQTDESPTDVILHDWPFLLNLSAWGGTVFFIIYLL